MKAAKILSYMTIGVMNLIVLIIFSNLAPEIMKIGFSHEGTFILGSVFVLGMLSLGLSVGFTVKEIRSIPDDPQMKEWNGIGKPVGPPIRKIKEGEVRIGNIG